MCVWECVCFCACVHGWDAHERACRDGQALLCREMHHQHLQNNKNNTYTVCCNGFYHKHDHVECLWALVGQSSVGVVVPGGSSFACACGKRPSRDPAWCFLPCCPVCSKWCKNTGTRCGCCTYVLPSIGWLPPGFPFFIRPFLQQYISNHLQIRRTCVASVRMGRAPAPSSAHCTSFNFSRWMLSCVLGVDLFPL